MNQPTDARPHTESVDLFQAKWLNFLTRSHILVPISMVAGFSAWLLYRSSHLTSFTALQTVGLFLAGLLFFTFAEYALHRNLYHLEPTSQWRKRFTYIVHGVHHDYPKDRSRIAMPPVGIVIYLVLFYAIFTFLLGNYGYSTLAGFGIGYCVYISIHYMVHAFRPPNNIFRTLWTNHAIHHYQDDTVLFGVSSPLWDYVFGTLPKKKTTRSNVEVSAK